MLAVPLVALVIVAGFGFGQLSADSELLEDAELAAEETVLVDSIGRAVGVERLAFFGGASGSEIAEVTEATDAVLENAIALGSNDVDVVAELVRTTIDAGRDSAAELRLQEYRVALGLVDEFVAGRSTVGFSADGIAIAQGLQQARFAAEAREEAWFNALSVQDTSPATIAQVAADFANADNETDDASRFVTEAGERIFDGPSRSDAAGELLALERITVARLTDGDVVVMLDASQVVDFLMINRAEWNDAAVDGGQFLQSDIFDRASQTDSDRSLFTLLAGLGAFLLAVLIFVISRSIVGPLSRLISEAEAVRTQRLPRAVAQLREVGSEDAPPQVKPIARETNDEIGALVDAFNSVTGTAMKVSTDQARSRRNVAEMFVSLGRRNQQLNHRMINLISELERDEQDPEVLQGLYRLDHMATRMRRNAESLLVLAGNRSPRQWSSPVPVEDVVRSSLSEVENFARIAIGDIPDVLLRGAVVSDIAHLIAELLDNSTNFSDPSTTVSVSAFETFDTVEIEITDEGFGINESDLADLNARISNPPELDEAPSRLLGLFVVGRLAKQHGIDVTLDSQPGVGTVATISLPQALIPNEVLNDPSPLKPIDIDPGVGEEVRAELGLDVDTAASAPEGDSWSLAASDEDELAEATVPTMDEVEEAMPSFPQVGIDGPQGTPDPSELPVRSPSLTGEAPAVAAAFFSAPETPTPPTPPTPPTLPTPPSASAAAGAAGFFVGATPETPDVASATSSGSEDVGAEEPQPASGGIPPLPPEPDGVVESTHSIFDFAPPVTVTGPGTEVETPPVPSAPVTPKVTFETPGLVAPPVPPAIPTVQPTGSLPAPPATNPSPASAPVVEAPVPVHAADPDPYAAAAPVPEVAPAPTSDSIESLFGDLPVRAPQAALQSDAGAVMPLPEVNAVPTAPAVEPGDSAGAFAAFASGASKGSNNPDGETSDQNGHQGDPR